MPGIPESDKSSSDVRASCAEWFLRRCRKAALLFCAALTMPIPSYAKPVEDAVRASLQTNPDIGIVAENQRAVEFELKQADSQWLPSLDCSGQAGYEATRNGTTFSRGNGEGSFGMPTYQSSLTLTQLLFDGNAVDADIARQESRVVSATRRVRETSEFIALDAIEAYLESLRQRELVMLAEENVRIHEETLQLVEQKDAGGAATTADVQQAESRLAAAQSQLTEAQTRLRDAAATYVRVIGEAPQELLRPVPPIWALPTTLEGAVALALRNNPTVAVTRADLETVRQESRTGNATFWSTVNLELSGNAARNEDGSRGSDLSASALVTVSYNFFRGFRDSHRTQELIHRIGEACQTHNRALRLTEEEMRIAWNARTSARDRLQAQRREVEANDRVRETYRQQFDVGGRNLLELLDSENEYFITRGNLVTTEFLEFFSIYRILASGGVLLASLDVTQIGEGRSELDPSAPEGVDLERSFSPLGSGPLDAPELSPVLGPLSLPGELVPVDPLVPLNPAVPLDPAVPSDPALDPDAPVEPTLAPLAPLEPILDSSVPPEPNLDPTLGPSVLIEFDADPDSVSHFSPPVEPDQTLDVVPTSRPEVNYDLFEPVPSASFTSTGPFAILPIPASPIRGVGSVAGAASHARDVDETPYGLFD